MNITKVRAEYISNKVNDKISNIFKELTALESILESDEYKVFVTSEDHEVRDVFELGALPLNFFDFLESLPEQL
jgi:hypothetical protein